MYSADFVAKTGKQTQSNRWRQAGEGIWDKREGKEGLNTHDRERGQ